jgi:phage terminase Nu1 subunit (DNA packaging protein)
MSETKPARAPRVSGHGGARPGAGRKPKDYVKPPMVEDFDVARARNESAKADLNELEFKVKSGEYVARSAVVQATATAYAALAQTLRSLPDHLERRLALAPEVAEEIGRQIDEALGELAEVFERMRGEDA